MSREPATEASVSPPTLRRLGRALGNFLRSEVKARAWLLLVALALLMLAINGMNVLNSYVGRDFISAIEMRDRAGFVRYAWLYAGVFGLSTVVAVWFRFAEERLALLWRDWLTRRAVGRYLSDRSFLRLKEAAVMSNPDQRITEDVRSLTVTTISFLLMIANGTVTTISFSGVLWSISPKLFLVAVLYAAAGSALTWALGRPLIKLNYRQADCEADFRADLIRVRENAEGIALAGFESGVRGQLNRRITALVQNLRRITAVNRNLSFFTTGYNYLIQLIPALFVAPLFMDGKADFGIIGQSAMAFSTLLGAFSLVVTQFQAISAYASVATRLNEFTEEIERSPAGDMVASAADEAVDGLGLSRLTLRDGGSGRIVVRELDFVLRPGRQVLVIRADEETRQVLMHVLAGLVAPDSGCIRRSPQATVAFVPGQPYLPPLPPRELLGKPGESVAGPDDEAILAVAREVGVVDIIERHGGLGGSEEWNNVLTTEERQRLVVARIALQAPVFAVIEQPGSAFGAEEARVVCLLRDRGVSCLVLAGRGGVPLPDAAVLDIAGDGTWQWSERPADIP